MDFCVYGASSNALDTSFLAAGEELGRKMAARGHGLVFGAGDKGMMGAVARGVQAGGGRIIGVVPSFFNVDGVLFEHCTETVFTDTMRQRKEIMEQRSDGFIMTPGGIGTLDEFFEILTLRQLGQHPKPLAIYNINGYFDSLLAFLQDSVNQKFMGQATLDLFGVFSDADSLLDYLEAAKPAYFELEELKNISKT